MEPFLILILAGIIIFLGFLGEIVFRKTNIPDVIWLIIFGIILRSIFHVFDPRSVPGLESIFTTFALIFILFEGALNIKFKELFRGAYSGTMLAIINFCVSVVALTVLFLVLGHPWYVGLILGIILGGTSSAVVIPMIKNLTISKETSAALTLESAVTDVLCIVGTITAIGVVSLHSFSPLSVAGALFYKFVIAGGLGAVAAVFWLILLTRITQSTKSYMITIAFMLILFGLVELIGSSGAIACLAYGLVLGNATAIFRKLEREEYTSIKSSERFFYSEVSFILKSFFFVYLGMIINFSDWKPFALGLVIVLMLFFVRPISNFPLTHRLPVKDRAIIESMIPKGLAAAILAQIPAQAGIPGSAFFADTVLAVVVLSILFTTVLVYLAEKDLFWGVSGIMNRSRIVKKLGKK